MPIGKIKRFLSVVLILGSIWLIGHHLTTHQEDFKQTLRLNLKDQILLIILYLAIHQLSALKIFFLLKKLKAKKIPYWEWFKIFTVSRFANLHVTQGANIYRSIKLKHEYGFSYTQSFGLVTIFTWFECMVVFVASGILLVMNPMGTAAVKNPLLLTLLSVTVIFGILPWAARGISKNLSFTNKSIQAFHANLNEMFNLFTACLNDTRLILKIFMVSLISFYLNLWWVLVTFRSIGVDVNLGFLTVFGLIIFLSKTFNIVPGNLGLRELACGYLGKSVGWGLTEGIVVSAITRVVEYGVITILGIVFAKRIFIRKKFSSMKNT